MRIRKKIIYGSVLAAIFTTTFFIGKSFLEEDKKTLVINEPATPEDILYEIGLSAEDQKADEDPEKKSEEIDKPEKGNIDNKNEEATNEEAALNIVNKLVSWGFEKSSNRTINAVIIHSSYDALGINPFDLNGLIKEYRNYGVSPHYLIDRGGKIYRLVEEKNVAYHAGESRLPDGRTKVNEISLGIELMNTKEKDFTEKQYETLNRLLGYIKNRYKIKYVLGHDQIAPGRKDDPWNFDWNKVK